MSSITCPHCGSPVSLRRFFDPVNKPFCTRCGWNLDRAEAALETKSGLVRLIPVGIAGVILLVAFTASRAELSSIFLVPALFSLIALAPLWGYYSTRRAIAAAKFTVNPSLARAQLPLDPALEMLRSVPRPRRVRFRFEGSATVLVAFGAVAILSATLFVATSRRPFSPRGMGLAAMLPLLFVLLIIAVVLLVPFFREKRNLPLLRDGELAFAHVGSQQSVQQGKTSYSKIDYEFQTNTGQHFRNSCRDLTRNVFEDMTVPVFYDPLDPSKNIAACATYLKITDPFP
jgi:uncharacterized protein (DUF983 family)